MFVALMATEALQSFKEEVLKLIPTDYSDEQKAKIPTPFEDKVISAINRDRGGFLRETGLLRIELEKNNLEFMLKLAYNLDQLSTVSTSSSRFLFISTLASDTHPLCRTVLEKLIESCPYLEINEGRNLKNTLDVFLKYNNPDYYANTRNNLMHLLSMYNKEESDSVQPY